MTLLQKELLLQEVYSDRDSDTKELLIDTEKFIERIDNVLDACAMPTASGAMHTPNIDLNTKETHNVLETF